MNYLVVTAAALIHLTPIWCLSSRWTQLSQSRHFSSSICAGRETNMAFLLLAICPHVKQTTLSDPRSAS